MLSVVIITCNRASTLTKTILSCKEHCAMPWELVIVDNGSIDGTRNIVEKLCEEQSVLLNYYYSEVNLGVAGARNIGYDIAKGEVLYFIDDDAFVITEGACLDKAYLYMMEHQDVQVISTKIWDELWDGILPEITAHGDPMVSGVQLRSFIGCSHFMKKDNKLQSPIYPDNLFYGGEEIYLSYKIFKLGKRVEYYDGVYVEHHPSKNTRATTYEIYRNRTLNWFIVKKYYYPQPYLFVSAIVYLYRIVKLTKGSPKKLKEVNELKKERYKREYELKLSLTEMKQMNELFSWRYLV